MKKINHSYAILGATFEQLEKYILNNVNGDKDNILSELRSEIDDKFLLDCCEREVADIEIQDITFEIEYSVVLRNNVYVESFSCIKL